jgi:hypothetical protein
VIRIHSRLLMAAVADPLVTMTEQQAAALVLLVQELTRENPLAAAVLDMAAAMLRARCPACAGDLTRPGDGPAPAAGLTRLAPPGEGLPVPDTDTMSWQELTERRTRLLDQSGSAELAAVLAELETRARNYAASPATLHQCACGYLAYGLAAIDAHLDPYDYDDPYHHEIPDDKTPGDDL